MVALLNGTAMHQITGFYFFTHKDGRRFVIYSTLYQSGRFASFHDCTGMTEQQARGAFITQHNHEVDRLLVQKRMGENRQKIIV